MVPTPSGDETGSSGRGPQGVIPAELGAILLEVARRSIEHGLVQRRALHVKAEDFPPPLREHRATFVTLHRQGQLRGCIGMLEAIRPLVVDVAMNAFAAAFQDPRFSPLTELELADLELHLSVLSVPEPMQFNSEQDLLSQIRPGVDGLILEEPNLWAARRRGTFLPAVWETLPDRKQFLEHLKLKANLPAGYWSNTLRCWRYTAQSISS